MARILLIRLSALGDVAMVVPVVHSLAVQYPQHQFTMLSRSGFEYLFANLPSNVSFVGVDFINVYKGLPGLKSLYVELKAMQFDCVADLHDVLRTKYLRFRFWLNGIPMAHIDKERKEKKRLTQPKNKVLKPLKTSFERYADVLRKLNIPVTIDFESIYGNERGDFSKLQDIVNAKQGGEKWIGIAPFAKHQGKIYPLEQQEQVVAHFANRPNTRVFLFGGGLKEKAVFQSWVDKYPTVISMPEIGRAHV